MRLTASIGALALILRASAFVSAAGSEWQSMPIPTSDHLSSIWGSGPCDVFAVGEHGTILHYDGTTWSLMTSGTTRWLMAVWGSGPNDVFAVGGGYPLPTILHYDGAAWSSWTTSGLTSPTWLYDIWGSSPSDIFACGYCYDETARKYWGTVVHFDGLNWSTSWKEVVSGTGDQILHLWGSAPNDVFGVGSFGTILHYNGTIWSSMNSQTSFPLWAVWGSGPNDVFAGGQKDPIQHYDGTVWSSMSSWLPSGVEGIWGSGPNDVFATGHIGSVLHYNGTEWSYMIGSAVNPPNSFGALWGSGPDDVFVLGSTNEAGYSSIILHYSPCVLSLACVKPSWGNLDYAPEPTLREPLRYARDTTVTLTATPVEGKSFKRWEIYDPNFPNDANYVVVDSNNPITLLMDRDHEIKAVFGCGSEFGPLLPVMAIGLVGLVALRRRS